MDNWLLKRVALTPNNLALIYGEEKYTFLDIQKMVFEKVTQLVNKNIHQEKRVALLSNNSKDLYLTILALQQLNIEIVFINIRLSVPEISYQLQDAKVKKLIFNEQLNCDLSELKDSVDLISFSDLEENSRLVDGSSISSEINPRDYIQTEFIESKTTTIMYTSGTTGRPKGVLQTFGNHFGSAIGAQLNIPTTSDDVWICTIPIFHIGGFSIMMRSLIYGMAVELYEHFDFDEINNSLINGVGTIISVVPFMLKKLLSTRNEKKYSPKFNYMLLGGGAVEPEVLKQCEREKIDVIQSYGMTETCSQVVALNGRDALRKIGSAGKPMFTVSLKIDKTGFTDNVGEILIKSPSLTPGYLNQKHKFAEKITPDGWFRTGDIGYLDDEGFLFIKSRLSELIISGGENIYPSEIEQKLVNFPGINEVAVIGENNSKWGSRPVAFVVADFEVDSQKLDEFLVGKIAKFKIPDKYIFVQNLPKTASGKIKKGELNEFL